MVVKLYSASITAIWASTMTAAQRFIYLSDICRKSINGRILQLVHRLLVHNLTARQGTVEATDWLVSTKQGFLHLYPRLRD